MKYLKLFLVLTLFIEVNALPVQTGHAEVSLIKGPYIDNKLAIGIKMDMQENWHTYWKNPGDSGGPIKVNWLYDENIAEISDTLWPAPELIPYPPLMTYGYNDFVIFPYLITFNNKLVGNKELNSNIEAKIDFLICDDICVPEKAYINTSLSEIVQDTKLTNWLNRVPSVTLPTLVSINQNFIEIRFSYNEKINSAYFYIESQDIVSHAEAQTLTKEENNWLLKVPIIGNSDILKSIKGVISVNNQSYIIDSQLKNDESNGTSITFLQAIIFAFLGGIILNLMPCVFPIISLKILSFISISNESTIKIRQHALSFCLGVILSFLTIGLLLVFLKQAGTYLGWGFQLQSPITVGLLSILMFLIGIILLTDINIGSSLTRLGGAGSNSLSGSFLTGVLAVIVASPCTAPFMGAALGYALIQPSNTTLPIFGSLGLGFAMPYLILSIFPGLIRSLPKPGQWMVTLKEFFAFPMFATSLWLVWVFSLQTNTDLLISLLLTMLIIASLLWIIIKLKSKSSRLVLWALILISILYESQQIVSTNNNINDKVLSDSRYANNIKWELGIEEKLQKENQAYLINFTAAWCITCQANDKIALSRPKIKNYLNDKNIKYIVADWTNKDDEILQALELYGRNGVPLYVYWKPNMEKPVILPSILTEQILLDNF